MGCSVAWKCSVAVEALIATTNVIADQALPEMHPRFSHPHTILAALRRCLYVPDLVRVAALLTLQHVENPPQTGAVLPLGLSVSSALLPLPSIIIAVANALAMAMPSLRTKSPLSSGTRPPRA
jgi:hypothetical protein